MVWYILNIYNIATEKKSLEKSFSKMKYVDNIYTLKNHNINPSNSTAKKIARLCFTSKSNINQLAALGLNR